MSPSLCQIFDFCLNRLYLFLCWREGRGVKGGGEEKRRRREERREESLIREFGKKKIKTKENNPKKKKTIQKIQKKPRQSISMRRAINLCI